MTGTCGTSVALFEPCLLLPGHSLGGGIAECAFLELLAAHDHEQLVLPVCAGGVYTFGAPLIVHGSDGMQAIKSMYENARKGDG